MSTSFLARLVARPWVWAAFVGVLFVLPLVRAFRYDVPEPLPVLGLMPEFALSDEKGNPITAAGLRGRVWVAGFIDSTTDATEPVTQRMKVVQHRSRQLGGAFHLVSFSTSGADTAERLAAYARTTRASPRMWSFVPGSDLGRDLAKRHGGRLLLVDSTLRIRGTYDAVDEAELAKLMRDLGLVINRGE